jgi:hypothetical protein
VGVAQKAVEEAEVDEVVAATTLCFQLGEFAVISGFASGPEGLEALGARVRVLLVVEAL